MTPFYKDELVTIYHGDFRRWVPVLDVAAVVTDPPYEETGLVWDTWPEGWPAWVLAHVPPAASLWCWGSLRLFLDHVAEFSGWKIAFNFAKRQGYLVRNPADRLDLPKVIHDEPTIFSLADARRLMAATLFHDRHPLVPACRAYLAIGMFAGLRPEEIERLEWAHVDFETATIRVPAANAKDRDRRIVEMRPNLIAWLRPLVQKRGRVLPHPVAKLRAAARTILGLADWPADIMRHTFVSYHFGAFQNEAYTKQQVGHRDDGRIFYNHYMVPISRPVGVLFFGIIPPVALIECPSDPIALAA